LNTKQKQDQLTPTAQVNIKKNRDQQPDSKEHGKRDYNNLPAIEEIVSLSDKNAICPYRKISLNKAVTGSPCLRPKIISDPVEVLDGLRTRMTRPG